METEIALQPNMGLSLKKQEETLQLSPIKLNEDYCLKWNIHSRDFVHLTKNGELISNSLYRIGGFGIDIKANYFLLLKHIEALYADNITTDKQRKPHLEGRWCILDKNGMERVVFDCFKNPYLIKDSCIYSVDDNYYNIETGELYCKSYKSMASSQYLFLENLYDDNSLKRGIMKIDKKLGTWELFTSKGG